MSVGNTGLYRCTNYARTDSRYELRFQHHPEQLPGCVAPGLPNMSARKSWYDLPLFPHRNQPAVSLKYDAQAKSMRSALEECGIHTSAVTHINRKWGAQLAERGGASQADIAR